MRYEYDCSKCKTAFAANLPLENRDNPQPCPKCGQRIARNLVGSNVYGQVFREYSALSFGVPTHVLQQARQDERGNWQYRDPATGQTHQLNRPGERIDPRDGGIIISTSDQRREYMKANGGIELNDFKDLRDHQESVRREAARKTKENRRRNNIARRIAAQAGHKTGWIQ